MLQRRYLIAVVLGDETALYTSLSIEILQAVRKSMAIPFPQRARLSGPIFARSTRVRNGAGTWVKGAEGESEKIGKAEGERRVRAAVTA